MRCGAKVSNGGLVFYLIHGRKTTLCLRFFSLKKIRTSIWVVIKPLTTDKQKHDTMTSSTEAAVYIQEKK